MSRRVNSFMFATHPFYACWYNLFQRCENREHANYRYYGRRGITISDEWKNFQTFYFDMYATWEKGLELDRIDNDKGYSRENCKWSTKKENCRHTRATKLTEEQVDQIRQLSSSMSQRKLGKMFGVSSSHICRICNFEKWA